MKTVPVMHEVYRLMGGLDQVTPTTSLAPGVARAALNFEVSVSGGYSRAGGYERVDGRVGNPSDATFSAMMVDYGPGVNVGNTLDNSAGATGTVIAVVGDAVFYTKQVGTFTAGDTLTLGRTVVSLGASVSARERAAYTLLAAKVYRDLILPVPGSGDIRGVAFLNDVLYAWRDNAGATLLEMYKATTAGWVQVVYGYEISFNLGGPTIPTIGGTIQQAAPARSAVVRAISLESGSWAAGTAAGRFITDAPSGGAFTAVALSAGGTATCNAGLSGGLVQALITFLPGGRVQTTVSNFGNGGTKKLYGCDNVNRGFEFDGTTMVPIKTGMATDKPNNVLVHKNYLFFSFGASLQNSGIGTPYAWTPVLGAGEYVARGDIKALLTLPGSEATGAMGAYLADGTFILYGTSFGSGGNGQFVEFDNGAGCEAYTAQTLDQPYALNMMGVGSMSVTQKFGNFLSDSLTLNLLPFTKTHRGTATASGINREKSQYRVFFDNGDALFVTMVNGKFLGAMPMTYPNPVTCWCEGSSTSAAETGYFGSTDGYVRRMDVGPSFDGATVPFALQLNFNSIKNPRVLKRYRKAALEIQSPNQAEFSVGYSLAYADPGAKAQPPLVSSQVPFSGVINYDAGYTYDSGQYYDGRSLGPVEVEVKGSAENISMQVMGSTAIYEPFTINTITIHYTPRRGLR